MKKLLAAIMLAVGIIMTTNAQEYRFDAGVGVGLSGYLGDANKSNVYKKPGIAGGLLFRYLPNYRWALKGTFNTASLSGDSATGTNVYPEGTTYSFKSQIYDLGAQVEFNFFDYGVGPSYKKLKRLTPYLTLGIGGTMSSTSGNTAFAVNLPMGFGLKYKLKERLNLGLEFTMRKVFGDKVDGLSDLNGMKSGFAKNTDWYSLTVFTISYEFSKRCTTCHYVE